MERKVYRFTFDDEVPLQDVEESLILSALAAEGLHGQAKVRLFASFCLCEKKRVCVIDVGTEVGLHVALIFTGFLIREFGEDAFKVEPAKPRAKADAGRQPSEDS